MRKAARTVMVMALGAALGWIPTTASAETARVHDPVGDAMSPAVDVTTFKVQHDQHRIRGVATIPRLKPGRLSGTEMLIKTAGRKKVYAVVVLRNRRGKVVDTSLNWRPLNDPVEPTTLSCTGVTTSLSERRAVVSVPTSCLTKTKPNKKIRAKIRTIDGTTGLQGAYFNDQTRFSPPLQRCPAR